MAYLEFTAGAFAATLLAFSAIQFFRRRSGYNNPTGSAVWSVWVALAIYGAGSREDWRIGDAAAYVVSGFVIWAASAYLASSRSKTAAR